MQPSSSEVVSLADLIQVACANRRCARVRFVAGGRAGVLHLFDGEVVHASFGGLDGNAAVYAAVTMPGLSYQVDPEVPPPWRNVSGATAQLLLEAARLSDEGWTPVTASFETQELSGAIPGAPFPSVAAPSGPMAVVAARGERGARPRSTAVVILVGGLAAVAAVGVISSIVTRESPPKGAGAAQASAPGASGALATSAGGDTAAADTAAIDAAELTGPDDEPPRLLEGLSAPRPAVDLALTPTIVCRLRIDTTGAVAEARVFRSRLDLAAFEDAALTTVSHYRFRAARRNGAAVASWVNWPVTFREPGQSTVIRIKGSDTVGGKLGPALAAAFQRRRPDVRVAVEALGSSTAFVGLFDGTADIGASSRPVNAKEVAEAQRLGVRLSEIVIGYDGLAVIVHPSNPIASLSIDDASRLFRGEIESWKALGGSDVAVHRLSRPSYSGTFEFFRDKVIRRGDAKAPGELAADAKILETSKDIAAAVAADPSAVGYVGLGWAKPEAGVRAVPMRAGAAGTVIAPSLATVRDGTYPVYRTLLAYTRGVPRGDLAAFLGFVVSPAGQALVEEHGFVAPGPGADAELAAMASMAAESPAVTPEAAAKGPRLLARIEFEARATAISTAAREQLRRIARAARTAGDRLLLIGNADAEGAQASHEQLSAARARAVAAALQAAGVPADSITVEAAGASRPLETNTTRAGRSHNRRVDVFTTR